MRVCTDGARRYRPSSNPAMSMRSMHHHTARERATSTCACCPRPEIEYPKISDWRKKKVFIGLKRFEYCQMGTYVCPTPCGGARCKSSPSRVLRLSVSTRDVITASGTCFFFEFVWNNRDGSSTYRKQITVNPCAPASRISRAGSLAADVRATSAAICQCRLILQHTSEENLNGDAPYIYVLDVSGF